MILSNTPGKIKKFGRTPWRFQATFKSPLKELDLFVSTILREDGGFTNGSVTIDGIVFEPKNIKILLAANSLSVELAHDWSITADGKIQVRELLKAAFSDWMDFLFVPTPKPFVIYADHDEYATFYANAKSNLNLVTQALLNNGFKQIQEYQRQC